MQTELRNLREWPFNRTLTLKNGCMIWLGALTNSGYPKAGGIESKTMMVHRYVALGHDRPTDTVVMHTCDNSLCINPEHLVVGTQTENNLDSYDKGRKSGYKHPFRKLTVDDVEEIRRLWGSRQLTQGRIGKQFGIGQSTVSKIVNDEDWARIEQYRKSL